MKPRDALSALAVFLIVLAAASPAGTAEAGAPATKANLDMPLDAGGSGGDDDDIAPDTIVFYYLPVEADGFFFCLDRSGSMNDSAKFRRLQAEVTGAIRGFSRRVEFAIVFFDAGLRKFPESGRPAEASEGMKDAAIAFVMAMIPGKGTCPKPALVEALRFANGATAARKVILYLSDGFNSCPGMDAATYGKSVLAEVAARNFGRVRIDAIGVGPTIDEDWLRQLAAANGGSFSRIER